MEQRRASTVYGPVPSWRYGQSLGVDPILVQSTCSFNCIYCQLGRIQEVSAKPGVFVPTEWVVEDLCRVDWSQVDIVTISGQGEPTLAENLGEIIAHIKKTYDKPVMVLTNATLFGDPAVRSRVMEADIIDCKLDAASDEKLQQVNRPAEGITLESIVEGITALRKEFEGRVHLQCMFMPANAGQAGELADLIKKIQPDLVQINTPRRPYPHEWYLESRGDHLGEYQGAKTQLKRISEKTAEEIEETLKKTGVPVQSVFRRAKE